MGSLTCMTHRGGIAADGKTGDGCGLLLQKPDSFLRAVTAEAGIQLPAQYAVGMLFMDLDDAVYAKQKLPQSKLSANRALVSWAGVQFPQITTVSARWLSTVCHALSRGLDVLEADVDALLDVGSPDLL